MKKQIIALFGILILIVFIGSAFARILPRGENNHIDDCSFITNIHPAGNSWSLSDYQDISGNGWVALDVNRDGTKEIFNYGNSGYTCPAANSYNQLLSIRALGNFPIIYNINSHQLIICSGNSAVGLWPASGLNPYLDCDRGKGDNDDRGKGDKDKGDKYKPNWNCGDWSTCNGRLQTRTCTDLNHCGTTSGMPPTFKTCTNHCVQTTCSAINKQCGSWDKFYSSLICPGTILNCGNCPSGQNCISGTCVPVCTPNWQTGCWGHCINGQQTRTVTDLNNCGTTSGMPSTSQPCTSTCYKKECTEGICLKYSYVYQCIHYNSNDCSWRKFQDKCIKYKPGSCKKYITTQVPC